LLALTASASEAPAHRTLQAHPLPGSAITIIDGPIMFTSHSSSFRRRFGIAVLVALSFAAAESAAAAPAYVQSSSQSGSGARSASIAVFSAVQTAGNLNVIFIGWEGSASSLISVADSAGNAYTRAQIVSYGTTATQVVFYARDIVGAPAGGNSVTATFDSRVGNPDLRIVEYSGVDPTRPLDVAGGQGGQATLTSSGAVATTNATDILVASNFSQQSTTAAGAGYTLRMKDQYAQIVEDATVGATGKYTATAPQTKSGWYLMQLVALRAAAAAPVMVPNVVGQAQAGAGTALTAAGLALGTTTQQSSVTVAAGYVISESPLAGASVASGSSVNLVVSSGPSRVSVPNVVGQAQSAASTAITALGLAVGSIVQQSSTTIGAGTVISESPAAGTSVLPGAAVSLVVSSGPPVGPLPVTVPNVVGQTQASASGAITSAGLIVGTVTSQTSSTVAAGTVISESPAAGTAVTSGSAVLLVVSSGSSLSPPPPPPPAAGPYPPSVILAGISWDQTSKQRYAAGSDIWDSAWASDGLIYGVWGDGTGFSAPAKKQIGVSQLTGSPNLGPLTGADVYLGSPSPRTGCGQKPTVGGKPHGVAALPNAVIYMFHSTYDLCTSQAWLARSLDNGAAWTDNVGGLWPDANGFAPVTVLQYGAGQFGALMPDSSFVPYIYIYGNKTNNPGLQYLARVASFPSNAIETSSNWSYYAGADAMGNPLWAASSAQAAAVWADPNDSESLSVSFNAAIGRYIAYNDHGTGCGGSACERQVSLFDGPSPWGPWTTFDYEEQFDNTNCGSNCLADSIAVGWAMMQKWFSPDGLSLWVEYSGVDAYDSLNLIKGTLSLAAGSTITHLKISTGTPAVVDVLSLANPGNLEFIDSPARLTSVPSSYLNARVIRLARNDAAIGDPAYVSFTSTVNQNVCVGWNSANPVPAWLAGWSNTGNSLVGDATFNVYRVPLPAGPFTLPGAASADGYILLVGC